MNTADLVQLLHTPELLIPTGEPYMLTEYSERAYSAILCQLTGVGIEGITSASHINRVFVFNVTPVRRPDPPILVCLPQPLMNLKKYYALWSDAVQERGHPGKYEWERYSWNEEAFQDAMRTAVLSAKELSRDEIVFAITQMLMFKNEILCR